MSSPERRMEVFHTAAILIVAVSAFALSGCRPPQDQANPPSFEPLDQSSFFDDGGSARPLVEGTVSRSDVVGDELLLTGKQNGQLANVFPFPVTDQIMQRGQERYNIYCTPCHGRTGYGDGMVVQRGYKQPPSYHIDRLRQEPVGHFVDVMTNGFGVMPSYRPQISPQDRWAIAAYIRALQLSQNATMAEVPPDQASKMNRGGSTR
ncbi:MAG: cytochrome c [Acidobacteriota bacterium]